MVHMTTTFGPCTVGPSAVTGERCGKPGVTSFTARGETFFECAEHNVSHIVGRRVSGIEVGTRVTVVHIGIEKVGTVVHVGNTRVKVEVPIGRGRTATTKVITRAIEEIEVVR